MKHFSHKTKYKTLVKHNSFTLVELLIVIGILAILTATVVIVLNPSELLRQSRDGKRMTELASITSAIKLLQTQTDITLGTASTVYISIPDTSATCVNLSLPTLPSGYSYSCVPASSSTRIDGTGWIPINFTQSPIQNISALPIDSVNTTSSNFYYTYITDGRMWKMSAPVESKKYIQRADSDGGSRKGTLETGTNLDIVAGDGMTCKTIKDKNPSVSSGIYWIQPNELPSVQVYCDMTNDGGGWTLVLNSSPSTPQPSPNWVEATTRNTIKGTMGTNLSSFDQWLGVGYWNDIGTQMKLEQGASSGSLSHKATYTFSINENNKYTLSMSNETVLLTATGTASPGMYTYHRNRPLTTYDQDNDENSGNCSSYYANTPWWYGSCWSGSFWGWSNDPYWSASNSESFSWGGIWIR